MDSEVKLFVSHSAKDAEIAEALIELIRNALGLPENSIRCTSVDRYRLPGGVKTEEQLREETLIADDDVLLNCQIVGYSGRHEE